MAAARTLDDTIAPELQTGSLDALKPGDEATIASVGSNGNPRIRQRMFALGFVPGTVVKVLRRAPLGDPTEYEVRGGRISLRKTEASLVLVSR